MAKLFLNTHWLKNTYFAISQSIIEYGIVAWGGVPLTYKNNLQVAQHTTLKIIFHKPRLQPTKQLYSDTKLLSIKKPYHKKLYSTSLKII